MTEKRRGSVTVEMLLLTPVLMLLGMFALHLGRWSGAQLDVQHAADSAARAASMVSANRMSIEARAVAVVDLMNRGAQCVEPTVSTKQLTIGGIRAVRVVVECDVNGAGTDVVENTKKHVVAESTEYIDVFTFR